MTCEKSAKRVRNTKTCEKWHCVEVYHIVMVISRDRFLVSCALNRYALEAVRLQNQRDCLTKKYLMRK